MSMCRTKGRMAQLATWFVVLAVSFVGIQAMADAPPTITGCPPNVVVDADPATGLVVVPWTEPLAHDDVGITSFTHDYTWGHTFHCGAGVTTVTYTAVDTIGQTATCSFTVTVNDVTSPVALCKDITIYLDGTGNATISPTDVDNGSYDACGSWGISVSSWAFTCADLGPNTVTMTVDDFTTPASTCDAIVTVVDNIPPVLSACPGDFAVPAGVGVCYWDSTGGWAVPTATDNCSAVVTSDWSPGDLFPIGDTTVTYIATDPSGNTDSCSFTVTVTDNELPTITPPGPVTVNNDPGFCYATNVNLGTPLAVNDNCYGTPPGTPVVSNDAPAQFPVGTTTVTWTVTDNSGNTNAAPATQTVTVVDTENPSISCQPDVTLSVDPGECYAVYNPIDNAATAIDNCPGAYTTPSIGPGPTVFFVGDTVITWTATDAAGNTSTCDQTITVVDDEAPTITCPPTMVVANWPGECGVAGALLVLGSPTTDDNCPGETFTNDAPAYYDVGITIVTWTVEDAAGNTASCKQIVEVVDNDPPVIGNCPGPVTVDADPGLCTASGIDIGLITPAFTDNCPGGTATHNAAAVYPVTGPAPATPHVILWTIEDAAGNPSTCPVDVYVLDNEKPTIQCPADISVGTDPGSCDAVVTWATPVTNDNCGVASSIPDVAPGSVFTVAGSPHTVTYTVTDLHGNVETCSFTVTVTDDELPTITCPADLTVALGTEVSTDAGVCYATGVGLGTPGTGDNCGVFSVTNDAPAQFPIGFTTVTWTVTDTAGLTATCVQRVEVVDKEFPVISGCPANIPLNNDLLQCGAVASWTPPTVTENCTLAQFDANYAPGDFFPVGTTTVTYTAKDAAGNTATCSFNVIVTDAEAPVARCKDITIYMSSTGYYPLDPSQIDGGSTDNCGTVFYRGEPDMFGCADLGEQIIPLIVEDAAGNMDSCTAIVTVVDDHAPVITSCPSDQTVPNDPGRCDAVVTWLPGSAYDNCGLVITVDFASGSIFPIGTTTVTMTATDGSNNSASCTFDITVEDKEAPVMTCPAPITQFVDSGECFATVLLGTPTVTDNCDPAPVVTNDWTGGPFPTGPTTVTWTAADADGNFSTCTQLITVQDNEPPVAKCKDFTLELDATGNATLTWQDIDDGSTDNCLVTSYVLSKTAFDCTMIGTEAVTMAVYDAEGNADSCVANVTIVDLLPPDFYGCPSNQTINLGSTAVCSTTATWTPPTINDNCGILASYTWSHNPGDTFQVGVTTVTYTAIDANSNTATCSFDIIVTESDPPVITCPADISVNNDAGLCSAVVSLGTATATDICDPSPVITNDWLGGPFPVGVHTVTWTAIDTSGNVATCPQIVTVTDNEAPVISCPANITVFNDPGLCSAVVNYTTPVGTDNCPGAVTAMTAGLGSGAAFPVGVTTETYEVTDAAGLTASCSFTVTVIDNEAPVISCPANITVNNDPGLCSAVVNYTAPVGTDNCPGAVTAMTAGLGSGAVFPVGVTTETYEVTDAAGNKASCSFTVTVIDNEAPVISGCPADIAVYNDAGLCSAVVTWTAPTAADNCSVVSFVWSHAPGDTFAKGTTAVTYTATDSAGLTATCTFNVTVIDNEAPVITCPADIAVNTDPGVCYATVALGTATATDNCDVPVITNDAPATFPKGVTTVTWKAMDSSGNWMTCPQTVTVSDVEAPVIACPADVTVGLPIGALYVNGAAVSLGAPTVTDNCAIASIVNDVPGTYPPGVTTVTWTATDTSGNVSVCTQLVNIAGTPVTFTPESTFGTYLEIAAPDPEQYFNDIKLAAVLPLGDVVNGVFGLIGASFGDLVDGVRVELIEVTGTTGAEVYDHIGFVYASYSAVEDVYRFEFQTTNIDPLVMLATGMSAPFDLLPGAYDIFVWLELPGGRHVSSPRLRILITP